MNEYILAYDLGTSGVKAAIVDFEGRLLCYREEGYPLYAQMVGSGECSRVQRAIPHLEKNLSSTGGDFCRNGLTKPFVCDFESLYTSLRELTIF